MRSRFRTTSWLTPALVLAALLAMAVPVSAGPESSRLWSTRQNDNRGQDRDDRSRRWNERRDKFDDEMRSRSRRLTGTSRVIITFSPGQEARAQQEARKLGARLGRRLRLINGMVVELPNRVIKHLAQRSEVLSIHYDRPTGSHMSRAAYTVGARYVQQWMGLDGAGIGVAVIDSGVASWHDDLGYRGASEAVRVVNEQRVAAFVDFVNGQLEPYDDNGHGTHVAGVIAGDGYDSDGAHAGIAPGAHLVSLKVLDRQGRGVISDIIAALDWVVANRATHNIRVVNMSVGARVTESYWTDPLTLATKRAVDAGVVVVAAAGNLGQRGNGNSKKTQYGSITAPGNAPWVLTVGAYSTEGTTTRWDDRIANYSSRGPTAVDFEAKPDLVAPGTGVVSLVEPSSEFFATKTPYLLNGSRATANKPYLSLSGTSMAAPVVSGTVALMLQANPSLTPNLVKALLQYTAHKRNYNALTQGAGFLYAKGAVQLARFYATANPGDPFPSSWIWSRQIHWGNRRLKGGMPKPNANAWASNVVWGTLADDDGENIVWGTLCELNCLNIVWGTADEAGENIVWGTVDALGENIVWGTADEGENIVWGTATLENIVWGTNCGGGDCENIVWGTATMDLENIVWGTADTGENIVWGTNDGGENIVWGTGFELENIVWGTSGTVDEIVWSAAADGEDVTWGSSGEDAELFDNPTGVPVNYDGVPLDDTPPAPPVTPPDPGGTPGSGTAPNAGAGAEGGF